MELFTMNEEQRDIIDIAKKILDKELAHRVEELDHKSEFPIDRKSTRLNSSH